MLSRLWRTATALLIIVISLAVTSCVATETEVDENYDVRVILRPCDGITIDDDNIADIRSGRTVTFDVTVDDGYIYIGNTADADYDPEKGKLRLQHVIAPTTVDMIVVRKEDAIFVDIKNSNSSCSVSFNEKILPKPGTVSVSADWPDHLDFTGWSVGGYLEDGGELLSTNPDYTFYVDSSRDIYANFSGFTTYEIIYNLNGGHVVDTAEDSYSAFGEYNEIFAMQQTLESNGTFEREGYQPIGYSLEPAEYEDYASANDIPGFANMGGVTKVDGRLLNMYVVWAKQSDPHDFEYSAKDISYTVDSNNVWGRLDMRKETERGIEITGYFGDDDTVVIPEEIDGLKVMSIASNAFSGNIEKLVIPRTVKNIKERAFSACRNLREVVFFDSVVEVYDTSFPDTVSTVVLNAQRLPVYSGEIEGSFCVKYERLRQATTKKIVVISGSSSLNGLNSEYFEELMPGYSVVNYGTNAANPSLFFLEVAAKYTKEGDIVVHAPEHSRSAPMGDNKFHPKMFRGNEQCYDIFRDVDLTRYEGFWSSFMAFQVGDASDSSLVPAVHQTGKQYQLPTELNKYGDRSTPRPSVRGSFGGANEYFSYTTIFDDNLNEINKLYEGTGAILVMSFATHDLSRLAPEVANQKEYDKYTEFCQSKLDYPVISNIGTYIMEHKWFFDSEWHPNDQGAKIRTENLANDIKNYLANSQ